MLEQGFGDVDNIGMLLDEKEVDFITNTDPYQLTQILEAGTVDPHLCFPTFQWLQWHNSLWFPFPYY